MRPGVLSLRARLLGAFALFGLALVVTFSWVLPRLVLDTEDRIFARQLAEHVEQARAELAAGRALDPRPAPAVTVTTDAAGLAPALAAWIAALEPGRHEFNDEPRPGTPARELFVAVEALEDGRRLQVIYDVGRYEGMEGLWDAVYLTTMGAGLLVALVAVVVGVVLVRRLSGALRELEELGAAGPLDPAAGERAATRSDEVGNIARSWRAASGRARDALERERRFSRDASHELRTPITAARGALEMLSNSDDLPPERRAVLLSRVRGALGEMEDLVTGFLWLAREQRPGLELDPLPVAAEVQALVEELSSRAASRGLALEVERHGDPEALAPRAVVRIVLGNLLRNAIAHSDRGPIQVTIDAAGVRVVNPLPGAEAPGADPQTSFGFGLTIVRDLCRRFGWGLELGPDGRDRFVAQVALTPSAGGRGERGHQNE